MYSILSNCNFNIQLMLQGNYALGLRNNERSRKLCVINQTQFTEKYVFVCPTESGCSRKLKKTFENRTNIIDVFCKCCCKKKRWCITCCQMLSAAQSSCCSFFQHPVQKLLPLLRVHQTSQPTSKDEQFHWTQENQIQASEVHLSKNRTYF